MKTYKHIERAEEKAQLGADDTGRAQAHALIAIAKTLVEIEELLSEIRWTIANK